MKREWFFDRFCGAKVAVYAEDGKIIQVGVEGESAEHALGNIYKGRVANVVMGMQAAFIACGMEKNCYLPLDEAAGFSTYDGQGAERHLTLKEGDEILVQLVKPARGSKGAKVTADLSFVGKNLIFLPRTDFLGISRKITEGKTREKLLAEAGKLRGDGEGFIVRTAAEKASSRHLKIESEFLKRMYRDVLAEAEHAPVGAVVYHEYDLPTKVLRDSIGDEVSKIYVGDEELYQKIIRLVRMRSDLGEKKVEHYEGNKTLLSAYGLTEQLHNLAEPRVELPNGGDLVIDRTEAMTVIDVNTGKYTGDSDLESTVFETNLLAAREIARQVRLRNIGGIVAVDFIDMAEEAHKAAVEKALSDALAPDKAKTRVLPMSELCVTLFTRKRTTSDLTSVMLKPCPHCTRQGYVYSDVFMAMRIRSAISEYFANGYEAVVVELNRELMEVILREKSFSPDLEGAWKGKRVYMVPHSTYHEERFTIRGDNSRVLSLPDDAQILY